MARSPAANGICRQTVSAGSVLLLTAFISCVPGAASLSRPLHSDLRRAGACVADSNGSNSPDAYHQGFEGDSNVMVPWASDGSVRVLSNGTTCEHSIEGHCSYKLDVVLESGTYHYFGMPLWLPDTAGATLTARILVGSSTTARVGIGADYTFPPTVLTGTVAPDLFQAPTSGWQTVHIDLFGQGQALADQVIPLQTATILPGETGLAVDRWGIYVYGSVGQRATVYVDDVHVSGRLPNPLSYSRYISDRFRRASDRTKGMLSQWRRRLQNAERLPDPDGRPIGSTVDALRKLAASTATEIDAIAARAYPTRAEALDVDHKLSLLESAPAALRVASEAESAGRPLALFTTRPVRDDPPALDPFPIAASPATTIQVSAARGEYEPATLLLYALRAVRQVVVIPGPLRNGAHVISPQAIDVRLVKDWYQAGYETDDVNHKHLASELLLKDDALIRVDHAAQQNYLRTTDETGHSKYLLCSGLTSQELLDARPRDAASLMPVDVDIGQVRQYWLTVHVPHDAAPGEYTGTLDITWSGGNEYLPLRMTVHPFDLLGPRMTYSMYYRAKLSTTGATRADPELRSPEQYRADMLDLQAHGILYPTNYQPLDDEHLSVALGIRRQVGLPTDSLFNVAGAAHTAESPASLDTTVRAWEQAAAAGGFGSVYFYGIDEASGDVLASERPAWRTIREAGGRTFAACARDAFGVVGGFLDVAVETGWPNPSDAGEWHSVGAKVFSYGDPPGAVEAPETYRRNYGLRAWRAKFDGAMPYAYAHGFGSVWNDFDDPSHRDCVFSYPTINGGVPTLQWEALREGVDDVRYITTLEAAIARASGSKISVAKGAQQFLDQLDPETANLDETRAAMVQWIEALI